ncbi:MAG: TonB-dependent receptor [Alphaproteobacteria bacterium]|nr:TonB-dependent receptor [Alphaproteobacteria bacterium]
MTVNFKGTAPGPILFTTIPLVSLPVLLLAAATPAFAQGATMSLPEVSVTAARSTPRRPHHSHTQPNPLPTRRASRPTPPAAPSPAATQQGTTPIVTDRFATVTVVGHDDISRQGGGQLGDLLSSKPGITSSGYAPGASSRPIIRGLDMNRVAIVENGTHANGASDLGEDHFVPVDPLATTEVEVIRGPAALRYGSGTVGGVVVASNNRIPETLPSCALRQDAHPDRAATPKPAANADPCTTIETRTSFNSVDRGIDGGILLDTAGNNFAFHADAHGRQAGDFAVPAYPYRFEPGRSVSGRQPNSAQQGDGASIGGSYFFTGGFAGVAITHDDALYHIPTIDGADHNTRIDGHQTKITAKAAYRPDIAAIDSIRLWAAATDYQHNELGLADAANPLSDGVRQSFTNREQEGRVEVALTPVKSALATVSTTLGFEAGHQELTAPSPDNPGSLYNGLWDPNTNQRFATYGSSDFQLTAATKFQIGGRIEHIDLHGAMPDFPADYTPDGNPQQATSRNPSFTPKSGSIALIHNLPLDLVASFSAQYTERAPKPAELFSRGAHDATGTFDIGNPDLGIETAHSLEFALRRASGRFRFEATAYVTHFDNFIYRRLTGVMCADDFNSCGSAGATLNQAIYSQRDALFRGGEFHSTFDIAPLGSGILALENQFDIVRATFTDGSNVPRISPMRLGGGLSWHDDNWLMRVNLLHAFAQNDIATSVETPTPSYNLLKAEVSYRTKLNPLVFGAHEMTLGITGDNLLNVPIRNAVSYSKDQVLMPGIGGRAFANFKF